jgi:acyl-CoA reductase-like NAD-dependent aldehyde dehydrogenase
MGGTVTSTPDRLLPWINGKSWPAQDFVELVEPYGGAVVSLVGQADAKAVEAALSSAESASHVMAAMPVHERSRLLRALADLIALRADDLAPEITRATGKVISHTLRETRRVPWTVRAAATAAETLMAPNLPSDLMPGGEGVVFISVRHPMGIVAAITPFNAPLNLVAHKVAPALAVGNSVIIKPSSYVPGPALQLAQMCSEVGFPDGAVNVIPGGSGIGRSFLADERVSLITFTGGTKAGRDIRAAAGLRPVLLELGGNSANIVHRDADIKLAVSECVVGGFSNNGQSCNSVQRIIIHEEVYESFRDQLIARVATLKIGDPMDPSTDIGPLISEASAIRVMENIESARVAGAEVLIGGSRTGAIVSPTVISGVDPSQMLYCDEAFAPVVLLEKYTDINDAFTRANSTQFALQAAIFTTSISIGLAAFRSIRAGSVILNRSSNFRLDHLPYGGIGESGIGREGPLFAAEAMTYIKSLVIGADR